MVICKECNREFESIDSLRRHRSQKHSINAEQTYVDYVLDGIEPKCKCGCGEKPKYLGIDAGFRDYKRGHAARISNNWGHNPEALKKSHQTQKTMHSEGALNIWNKGLTVDDERVRNNIDKVMANPERGNNISKALIDVPKSQEHKSNLKKGAINRWSSSDERNQQKFRRINYLKHRQFNTKTKLEEKFENIINLINLDFEPQYSLKGYLYDFYLKDYNILLEVDGDWYHCNPEKHPIPLSIIQQHVVANDIRKNKIAEENNIKLLRFWETNINTKPEEVIIRLKKELGL
jgi:very-short-patch-repair endonuclease